MVSLALFKENHLCILTTKLNCGSDFLILFLKCNRIRYLNPDSLKKLTGCKLEPSLADAKEGERFQFVRMGYYCKDRETGRFNRIVTLKDSFAKTLSK